MFWPRKQDLRWFEKYKNKQKICVWGGAENHFPSSILGKMSNQQDPSGQSIEQTNGAGDHERKRRRHQSSDKKQTPKTNELESNASEETKPPVKKARQQDQYWNGIPLRPPPPTLHSSMLIQINQTEGTKVMTIILWERAERQVYTNPFWLQSFLSLGLCAFDWRFRSASGVGSVVIHWLIADGLPVYHLKINRS